MSQDSQVAEPIDIDLVECQKENIEPLIEGRSAKALAKAFSQEPPDQMDPHSETRQEFERRIVEADEQDDPLESYLEYIEWIKETYPQGRNGPSGLIGALERCTHHFRQSRLYKNDPRYLKIWLQYIKYNDSPKEVFNFLLRNEIGSLLALFYENYAAYLESSGRITQAQQVYELGLQNQAAPTERLHRRYLDFVNRVAAMPNSGENDPSSPLMRPTRAALSVISGDSMTDDPSGQNHHAEGQGGFEIFTDAKPKLQVFSDPDGSQQPATMSSGGWDSIGSLASRRKENAIEARPWNGERMPGVAKQSKSGSQPKISVFRDDKSSSDQIAAAAGSASSSSSSKSGGKVKRPEKLAVDLSLVYPEEGVELSFDEIRAKLRGLLLDTTERETRVSKEKAPNGRIDNPTIRFGSNGMPEVPNDTDGIKDTKKSRMPKPEPTMTINTKAATDEIYSMFSQPLSLNRAAESNDNSNDSSDSDDSDDSDSDEDNRSDEEDGNTTIQLNKRLSDQTSGDCYDSSIQKPNDRTEIEAIEQLSVIDTAGPIRRNFNNVVLMTPIAEKTENLTATIVIPEPPPIIEHPLTCPVTKRNSQNPIIPDKQCNPLNEELRKDALAKLVSSFDEYLGYTDRRDCLFGQFDILAKKFAPSSVGERIKNTIPLSFGGSECSFQVERLLGRGAYGAVYLAYKESPDSENPSKIAIKAEKPANAWEFYILRQIEARFMASRKSQDNSTDFDYELVLRSIARPGSFFAFKDEGYLTLEYISQGTILDLVNMFKRDANLSVSGSGVDERVAMFLTIELMRVVESLHRNNILHGDIKPDNCMVRFEAGDQNNWSEKYTRTGGNGWHHKGIKLIDFGRSIDMTIFDPCVQFIADWKTDQQDCHEMRELRPWTYQVDYFGIASVAHCLLFGKYIETKLVSAEPRSGSIGMGATKTYKLTSPFKRYWQQDLWGQLFHLLLNSSQIAAKDQQQPIITLELAACRAQMESWLENNSHLEGVSLMTSIRKIETLLTQQHKPKTR